MGPLPAAPRQDVTTLLDEWSRGRRDALDRLIPLVFDELHRIAARSFRGERPDHLLQPTALVSEAYLRLVDQTRVQWANRSQFFGVAAELMRRILVDHARARAAAKRGSDAPHIALDADAAIGGLDVDVIALDLALDRLAHLDPQQAKVVEVRFFTGLTVEETATALGLSPRTVKREWQSARAWLYRELYGDGAPG